MCVCVCVCVCVCGGGEEAFKKAKARNHTTQRVVLFFLEPLPHLTRCTGWCMHAWRTQVMGELGGGSKKKVKHTARMVRDSGAPEISEDKQVSSEVRLHVHTTTATANMRTPTPTATANMRTSTPRLPLLTCARPHHDCHC